MDTFCEECIALFEELRGKKNKDFNIEYNDNFKSFYPKLIMIGLLTEHANAISSGELEPANPDSATISSQLMDYVQDLKMELVKEIFLEFILQEIMKEEVDQRKTKLNDYAAKHPILKFSDKYGFDLISFYTNFSQLDDFAISQIRKNLKRKKRWASFKDAKAEIEDYYNTNILPPSLKESDVESDVEKYLEIASKLEDLLIKYSKDHKYATRFASKFKTAIQNAFAQGNSDEDIIVKIILESTRPFSCIPQFKEFLLYYINKFEINKMQGEIAENEMARRAATPTSRIQDINDSFIVHEVTGEVIKLEEKSKKEKIIEFAKAVNGFSWRRIQNINDEFEQAVEARTDAIVTRTERGMGLFQKISYGRNQHNERADLRDKAKREATKELEEQYDTEYGTIKKDDGTITTKNRQDLIEKIANGETIPYSQEPVSFEELRFVFENFEYQKDSNGNPVLDSEGEPTVIDKKTKQVVLSKRTIITFQFAFLWNQFHENKKQGGNGINNNRGEYMHAMQQAPILLARGGLNVQDLRDEKKGSGFFKKAQEDKTKREIVKRFYEMQNPKAIEVRKARNARR